MNNKRTADEYILMLQAMTQSLREVVCSMKEMTGEGGDKPFKDIGERLDTYTFHIATLIGDLRNMK
jgi:hypothetical protein